MGFIYVAYNAKTLEELEAPKLHILINAILNYQVFEEKAYERAQVRIAVEALKSGKVATLYGWEISRW